MTDTTATTYPDTPAAVAAAVLDAIEREPEAFDMASWFWQPEGGALEPGQVPDCGTTMCVAGWAAHLTGWTLRNTQYAQKGDLVAAIEDIGQRALGLDRPHLFHESSAVAINALREIAGH
ncbi:hypothetical protein [Streptomyces sp. NPDC045251]|uniref:hypothetical protein n=1 Tax=unclassified Streptomyces TaxID=2593676 RepID=UPI0034003E97